MQEEIFFELPTLIEIIENIKDITKNHSKLKYMDVVLNALINLIGEIKYSESNYLYILYSHIFAIRHCLRLCLFKA